VWLPLSLTLASGERGAFSVWEEFVRNTRKHAAGSALNQVGLRVVLAFDPNMRAERISKFWIDSPWDAWREARQRTVQQRRVFQIAIVGAFLILLTAAVRGRDDWVALTLGVAAIPFLVELSNYYYGILLALAFLWPPSQLAGVGLAITALSSNVVLALLSGEDDRYTAMSVVVLLFVAAVAAAFARRPTAGGVVRPTVSGVGA
jgi:hypothetical protein